MNNLLRDIGQVENQKHLLKKCNTLGYGPDAKDTTLQTALLYKDEPATCTRNAATGGDTTSGYQLRKNHVEKSQTVPFCTSLHVDFLQCPR